MTTKVIEKAKKFYGKLRRDKKTPAIWHLDRVATSVAKFSKDPEVSASHIEDSEKGKMGAIRL